MFADIANRLLATRLLQTLLPQSLCGCQQLGDSCCRLSLGLQEGEFSWGPVFNSVASGAGALGLAMVYFRRADF